MLICDTLLLGFDILHLGRSVFSRGVVALGIHIYELSLTISGDEEEQLGREEDIRGK
jgi:hypothetical protein